MRLQALIGCTLIGVLWPVCGNAEKIKNPIAVFTALDKITARIQPLEAKIDQTIAFGTLKVTPRVCNTRPPTEAPVTSAFVEVDEIQLDKSEKRIFTGWMFAQNPGVHAVEHPVFDVWLTNCKGAADAKPRISGGYSTDVGTSGGGAGSSTVGRGSAGSLSGGASSGGSGGGGWKPLDRH